MTNAQLIEILKRLPQDLEAHAEGWPVTGAEVVDPDCGATYVDIDAPKIGD